MENFENSKCSNYNLTLNKYYTKDKNTYTNTRMGSNPGKFYINKDQYDNFLKQYTEHVFFNNNEEFLTEKHEDYGPFVIDLDLKYELTEDIERKYTLEHIKKFIQLYISKIEQYCEFESDKERWAFVFEKSKPQLSNDCIKDGIHIMFPYLTSEADLQTSADILKFSYKI